MSNTDFVRISGCSLPNKALQQYKKNKIKKALHQTCVGNEFLNLEQLWDPPLNEKWDITTNMRLTVTFKVVYN